MKKLFFLALTIAALVSCGEAPEDTTHRANVQREQQRRDVQAYNNAEAALREAAEAGDDLGTLAEDLTKAGRVLENYSDNSSDVAR